LTFIQPQEKVTLSNMKIQLIDKRILTIFLQITSAVSAGLSTLLLFVDIPEGCKILIDRVSARALSHLSGCLDMVQPN
jgi:hypothetical protein